MVDANIKLKVAGAVNEDVNKGIVRIDSSFMTRINVLEGDVVQIVGKRTTLAIVQKAYPGDIGLNIIRLDGITRRNAKVTLGEFVEISKVQVEHAKKITIAPAKKGVHIRASPAVFKRGFLGRAILKGDFIALSGRRSTLHAQPGSPMEELLSRLNESSGSFGFGDILFNVVNTNPSKKPLIITSDTEIELNPEAVEIEETETEFMISYEDIGGLKDEISKIREMVELPLKHPEIFERLGIEPPKGVLLHGPPGTGKTLLAKAVASETNSHFILINGPEIMSKFYGESENNLRKKFEEAEKNSPSIIFIDEIDAIASKREEAKGEVEKRVVAQMLSLMDGLKSRGKVIVIAASNIPNALDPALRRPGRFDREIEIGPPNQEGRLEVLKVHTRNMPLDKKVKLKDLARITHGFVGADLSALAKESAMVVLRRVMPDLKLEDDNPIPAEILDELKVTQDDFLEALKVVRPSAMREVLVEIPNLTWEDIGGLEDVKQQLEEAVEWPLKQPKKFIEFGIKPPKGVLLYGPPGTGKTLLAKAVANQTEANFILVNGPSLLSKWVGESEKAVREVFRKARQSSPTVIFFDEIDAIAPKRGRGQDSNVTERVVNQLLTEIDGLEEMKGLVVIAATNRPDIVDSALLRPGRFDRIILCSVPDKKTREKIFEVHTKTIPLDGKVDLSKLADLTEGYVGADIEAVCREAAMHVIRTGKKKKVALADFKEALEVVKGSVTKKAESNYKKIKSKIKRSSAEEMNPEPAPNYFG